MVYLTSQFWIGHLLRQGPLEFQKRNNIFFLSFKQTVHQFDLVLDFSNLVDTIAKKNAKINQYFIAKKTILLVAVIWFLVMIERDYVEHVLSHS
jgi:hypothetical protein